MKKSLLIIAIAFSIISCNKEQQEQAKAKEFKTAYVNTSELLQQYTKAKDIDAKFKAKSKEMSGELEAEINRFKKDASNFQSNAKEFGQAWAQKNGAELQKREQQLQYAQQAMVQQLQKESGTEMDSLVSDVKKYVKTYGKEKGYDYIYATGEAVSILYAKDNYDITKEVTKLLNDRYAKESTSDAKTEEKTADKK